MPSTNNGRGSLTKSNSPRERITESDKNVKERFSYAGENANGADMDALDAEQEGLQLPELKDYDNQKIYPNMDDGERARILRQKEIRVPAYDSSNPVTGAQIVPLKGKYTTKAKDLVKALAEHCGVFNMEYYNADEDFAFFSCLSLLLVRVKSIKNQAQP